LGPLASSVWGPQLTILRLVQFAVVKALNGIANCLPKGLLANE